MTKKEIRTLISGHLGALVSAAGNMQDVRAAFDEIAEQGDMFWAAMAMLCSSETTDAIGHAAVADAIKKEGGLQ